MTRNRGVRPISMRLTLALTSLSLSLCTIGSASDESGTSLLDAARRAGVEASALVFEREADTAPDAEVGGRRSGKSIVLATVIASAAEEPEVLLLDAARAAGAEAAPLVFDRESETGAEVETDRRISGRTILLATAIASAAAVTVALLLRNRGGCRSNSSFSNYFWTWTNGVSGQWETRPDGSTVLRPGPIPVPLAAPPGGSLPDLCVAR